MADRKPVMLVILDGWGVSPVAEGNAISAAQTPTMHRLLQSYPSMALQAAGTAVGLPWGEAGNSEVGHLNLGAGRIVFQETPAIETAIADGSFFQNQVFIDAVAHVKQFKSALHFIGVVNPEEGSQGFTHVNALLELAKKQEYSQVYLHLLLSKAGSLEGSMGNYIAQLEQIMERVGIGRIATMSGQYYAMDREKRWEHTARAYRLMVDGEGPDAASVTKILELAAQQNLPEEYIEPTRVSGTPTIGDNDSIIFFNWRPERSRQLAKAFVAPYFGEFEHGKPLKNLYLVTMSSFEQDMTVKAAFIADDIKDGLSETLSRQGIRQLHLSETEKFAHVTTFFNGGHEEPFEGEEDIEIKSPTVRGYDEKPEMATPEVVTRAVKALKDGAADFYLVNIANMDMVGHTGNFQAATQAAQAVDAGLKELIQAAEELGVQVLITADHGNAEQMTSIHTGVANVDHSNNPVPLILVTGEPISLSGQDQSVMDGSLPAGMLADVAPTVLDLFGLDKPEAMTGYSLLVRSGDNSQDLT